MVVRNFFDNSLTVRAVDSFAYRAHPMGVPLMHISILKIVTGTARNLVSAMRHPQ
jgi:hypothetical protein